MFGTDGIREIAGKYPLDYSTIYEIGKNLTDLIRRKNQTADIIIGQDTRSSGKWIQQALYQGIRDSRGQAVSAGVIPTSAVAVLGKTKAFSSGIMISASHNPYEYNGIKIFSSEGIKINRAFEQELENKVISSKEEITPDHSDPPMDDELKNEYIDFLKSKFPLGLFSEDIKVVIDCANGASSGIAPRIFQDLGLNTSAINSDPDGKNINSNCGSLYPENLVKQVLETKADLGIAYDGDSDRAIFVDEKGNILNGDHTLFILSKYMKAKGLLSSQKIVGTIISNLGLEESLRKCGLFFVPTNVGDKNVYDEMIRQGSNLGGEPSGHTILLDECHTGDGILTSLKIIEVMIQNNCPVSLLCEGFQEYPQVQKNIRVTKKEDFNKFPGIMKAIKKADQELRGRGRVKVRYSGTEPLARVMIQGEDREKIENLAQMISKSISEELK